MTSRPLVPHSQLQDLKLEGLQALALEILLAPPLASSSDLQALLDRLYSSACLLVKLSQVFCSKYVLLLRRSSHLSMCCRCGSPALKSPHFSSQAPNKRAGNSVGCINLCVHSRFITHCICTNLDVVRPCASVRVPVRRQTDIVSVPGTALDIKIGRAHV